MPTLGLELQEPILLVPTSYPPVLMSTDENSKSEPARPG
jgi:hypothetical protein